MLYNATINLISNPLSSDDNSSEEGDEGTLEEEIHDASGDKAPPNEEEEEEEETMPLTKKAPATKPASAVAKKPTPPSSATKPSPALKYYMGAYHPYAFTDEYSQKKTHRIDLVVYLPGHVKPGETPTVRIIDSTTVHIYSQFNKNILGENLPIVLGLSEESARYQAYCSIGQGLASSKQYKNDADRELLTGEAQCIPLLVKVKLMDPEVTVHPYENGMQRRSRNEDIFTNSLARC